jgi:Flp pilus assembly protein TadD
MGEHNKHLCPCGSGKRRKLCCRTSEKASKMVLEQKALRLAQAGDHSAACEALEQRVALSPGNPMIWNDLGNEYAAAGQLDRAISALKRALQVDSTFPLTHFNLGVHTLNRCLEMQKSGAAKVDTDEIAWEAIGFFNKTLVTNPDNAACHQNLATAYKIVQDTKQARTHMLEALRLTPASDRLPFRLIDKAKRLFSN